MSRALSFASMLLISTAVFAQESPIYSPNFPVIAQESCIEREIPHYYKVQEVIRTVGVPEAGRMVNTYFSGEHENLTTCDVVAKRITANEIIKARTINGQLYPALQVERTYQCLPVRICAFDQHE